MVWYTSIKNIIKIYQIYKLSYFFILASVTAITCPIGGLLAGYSLDKIGRKTTLTVINIISIISWLIMAYSSETDPELFYIELIVARVIIGE
jgi:MFS family permease